MAKRYSQDLLSLGEVDEWANSCMLHVQGIPDNWSHPNAWWRNCDVQSFAGNSPEVEQAIKAYPVAVFNDTMFRYIAECNKGEVARFCEIWLAANDGLALRGHPGVPEALKDVHSATCKLMRGIYGLACPKPGIGVEVEDVKYAHPSNGTQSAVMSELPKVGRGLPPDSM